MYCPSFATQVGQRRTLAIVEYGDEPVPAQPQLKLTSEAHSQPVYVQLNGPSLFPPTAGDYDPTTLDDGAPYSTTAWSVVLEVCDRLTIPYYGMVWHGMIWYGMVRYGMAWYGTVRYGMVWYGMV